MVYYWGESQCQATIKSSGKPCKNKAYYLYQGSLLCGVHSKKGVQSKRGINSEINSKSGINSKINSEEDFDNQFRQELPKNPNQKEYKKKLQEGRDDLVCEQADKNKEKGIIGDIICSKLRMMKDPDHIDGYLKIFPNFKHGGRTDGIGLPSLSPKSIGPIEHDMKFPNGEIVPVAKNLENFHQFAKLFKGESEEDFTRIRKLGYSDKIPYRHKFEHPEFKGIAPEQNKNIALCSIYYSKDGKEQRYNYIESRYFYCHHYEAFVKKSKDYQKLVELREDGFNLQIIGYDGKDVEDKSEKGLYKLYLDPSSPFGHELVLFSMLVLEEEQYPWRIYYKENLRIYEGII